jgi:hypothetical protein
MRRRGTGAGREWAWAGRVGDPMDFLLEQSESHFHFFATTQNERGEENGSKVVEFKQVNLRSLY